MILFSAKYTTDGVRKRRGMLVGRPRPFREGPVARPGAAGPPPPDARRPRSAHQRPGRHRFGAEPTSRRTRRRTPPLTSPTPRAASDHCPGAGLVTANHAGRQRCGPSDRPGPGRAGPGRRLASGPDRLGRHPPHVPLRRQATRANVPVGGHVMHTPRQADVVTARHDLEYRSTVSPRRGGGGLAGRRRGSRSGIRPRCRPGRSSTCGGRCGRSPGGRRVRRCR